METEFELCRGEASPLLGRVSARMMSMKNSGLEERFPVSLIDMECWEWPQGVGLYGLYRGYQMSGDEGIWNFLLRWFDSHLKEGVHEKNVNTTAPMLTLTYLYEQTGNQEYLAAIGRWADWMMDENGLLRAGDGCFQHMITGNPNPGEVLIDTLFMAVLFLNRAGKLLGREECRREAQYQILTHIKYLYCREEGLFCHGWNFGGGHNYGKVLWGRGNSWYTIGIMEYLQEADPEPALKRYFLSVFHSQARALKKYQDPALSLWHTVVNDPDSYIETSAGAAFLAGLMKGVRLGILPKEEYAEVIKRGVPALLSCIREDGSLNHVSYGTPVGWDEAFYKEIPCCPMTYGQALAILLLEELLDDYWKDF